MTPERRAREQLVAAARHLASRGLSPGSSGNLGVRLGAGLLVTPTGSSLSRVEPDDLSLVGPDGSPISGPPPTKEVLLHLAVLSVREATDAVVHLHSPHAVALACLDRTSVPPLTPYHAMRLGDLPVLPYAAPGSSGLADGVRAAAAQHAALLLGNHGSLAAGATLDAAVDLAEEVETACQVALLTHGLPRRPLTDEEVAALRRT